MPISGFRSVASITKIMKMSMMPAAMEKRPRTRKNSREEVAECLGFLDGVGLDGLDGDGVVDADELAAGIALEEGLQAGDRGVGALTAGLQAAVERDAEAVDLAGVAGELLDAGEQHGAAAGALDVEVTAAAGSDLVLDDADHRHVGGAAVGVHGDLVADAGAELVGSSLGEIDVVGAELAEVGLAAAHEAEAAERRHAFRVDARKRDRRLGLLAALVDGGDRLEEERDEAVDLGVVGELALESGG